MTDVQVEGVDAPRVTEWFTDHVPDAVAPLHFDLIAGGHSNLTFSVTDRADGHWVLRRPPLGHVLATAHDMDREHRIIDALAPTDVPVPPAVALCTDEAVNGAPFYVMGFVNGTVVRNADIAADFTPDQRRRSAESLVDVMARIHAVDVDTVGLGDLGRREGYIGRQLKRWYGQFEKSATVERPAVREVHQILSDHIPSQGPATIVHGDYRLDNCLVDDQGDIAAVLDWEICTLGDPLADVGLLMVYWADADDDDPALATSPTVLDGFPERAELLARYAERSGRDVSGIDFYVAFGYWKLACIVEGVYARYRGGAMGDADDDAVNAFGDQVDRLSAAAQNAAACLR